MLVPVMNVRRVRMDVFHYFVFVFVRVNGIQRNLSYMLMRMVPIIVPVTVRVLQ